MKFVYDCGVIGLCPPCTRAIPLTGVWPCWLVGEWRKPCASKPTSQQGFCALLAGGRMEGGLVAQGFLHSPTSQQGHIPARGVALVHGGQIPISLENQINPPSTHI